MSQRIGPSDPPPTPSNGAIEVSPADLDCPAGHGKMALDWSWETLDARWMRTALQCKLCGRRRYVRIPIAKEGYVQ